MEDSYILLPPEPNGSAHAAVPTHARTLKLKNKACSFHSSSVPAAAVPRAALLYTPKSRRVLLPVFETTTHRVSCTTVVQSLIWRDAIPDLIPHAGSPKRAPVHGRSDVQAFPRDHDTDSSPKQRVMQFSNCKVGKLNTTVQEISLATELTGSPVVCKVHSRDHVWFPFVKYSPNAVEVFKHRHLRRIEVDVPRIYG